MPSGWPGTVLTIDQCIEHKLPVLLHQVIDVAKDTAVKFGSASGYLDWLAGEILAGLELKRALQLRKLSAVMEGLEGGGGGGERSGGLTTWRENERTRIDGQGKESVVKSYRMAIEDSGCRVQVDSGNSRWEWSKRAVLWLIYMFGAKASSFPNDASRSTCWFRFSRMQPATGMAGQHRRYGRYGR